MKKQIRLSSDKLKSIIRESVIKYLNEESGWYPAGTENDPDAPWNQEDPEELEKTVEVTLVLTANIDVPTTAYTRTYTGTDEDGYPDYDDSDIDYGQLKDDTISAIGAGENDKIDCLGIKWTVYEVDIDY